MTSQIAECLAATLSPDQNTRVAAELRLAKFFASPETGLALSQLIIQQGADIPLRQSASIVLRKYVKERWSPYFPTFKGAAPDTETKTQIRQAVFQGLSDSNRKIRTLCAHVLSSIAKCDWPDEYPELLTSLITLLSSNSPEPVHGAMSVLTEFIKSDLAEDQILPVLRQLLPNLLTILGTPETHSSLTRSRTVSVFRQCITALFMVKDQHPQATKEAVASVLPVWLEAFKVLLQMDPKQDVTKTDNWDGLAIRIQIFKTLDTIHTSFPRALTPYLQDFLNVSLSHLQGLHPTYSHYYFLSSDSAPGSSEDEVIELPHLICPILDFAGAVTRGGKTKEWFTTENLNALIAAIFAFVQMTDQDEETWATDVNAFVAQEEDETQPYSVRLAGFDLLGCLVDRSPVPTLTGFQTAIEQVVQMSRQMRDSGEQDWWRSLEAALAAIGSQAEAIIDCIEDQKEIGLGEPVNIKDLLINVIPSVLVLPEHPFLQGRAFVFASQYITFLPPDSIGQYLDAAIQVIETAEAGVPVKISAVKAIHNFCQKKELGALVDSLPRIAKGLGPFLFVTSEDALSLVLETLHSTLEVKQGQWLSVELAEPLTLASLEVWDKHNKDPISVSILTDILETLASAHSNGVYETVVQHALPRLNNALASAKSDETWVSGSAIELIASLVQGSPESGLAPGFFAVFAPSLFRRLEETEDRDVLQHGISCLIAIIKKDCNQLLSWNDSNGRSGLDHALNLIAKILNNQDESGGLVIGDLIIHLLRRAGESVLPVLPQLLQAMVGRMVSAKTATFIQSLVIPFAFLINNQRDVVLSLLESTTIDGRSGLDILIQTWCENAETFQGFWPSRISTLGLIQLFTSERPSVQNLVVKGDIIVNNDNKDVIMTRSRTKNSQADLNFGFLISPFSDPLFYTAPIEFTSIRFPVKVIKLLLHDVQSGGESATISAPDGANTYDIDSDDGDEEWAEEEKLKVDDELGFLSDMIGPRGVPFDNDEVLRVDDDDELRSDPVSQMDMQGHLVSFLRECAAHNVNNFSELIGQLTIEEALVIRHVVGGT